jgi:D-3-phosphoglycerate dehydrogenase / 2-oxoglutarate reductase
MTAGSAGPSVYVYDPVDEPIDWLLDRGVRVTLGSPVFSTGRSRPKIPADVLVAAAQGHSALMGASGAFITRRVMEQLPDLRYISKLGIGHEVIDLAAATERGIMVTNTPADAEVEPVAEHAIALMLALVKQLHWYSAGYIAGGGWRSADRMAGTLAGSTVGIVGLGHIGRAVAARLGPWGARLIGTDIRAAAIPGPVEPVDLPTLLRTADIVTLHLPGRAAGEGPLLGRERLESLKPGALLVNTARGNLVDQAALARLLTEGRIAGAAVDVYSPEPPPADEPLLSAPNVIATPHMAAWNARLRKEMAMMAFRNLWTMLSGGLPQDLVNPDVLDRTPR